MGAVEKMKTLYQIGIVSLLWLSVSVSGAIAFDGHQDRETQRPPKKPVVIEKKDKDGKGGDKNENRSNEDKGKKKNRPEN